MAEPFVAEVRIFAFTFPPKGWAFCAGQLLPISQNTALFSLLGTMYGGNGQSTFALPNLQGSVAIHSGHEQGPGLSNYTQGEVGGSETSSLLLSEIPSHGHTVTAQTQNATTNDPTGAVLAAGRFGAGQGGAVNLYTSVAPDTAMNPMGVGITGGGLPHNNLMPYLVFNYCIALQGVFPPRT